MKRSERACAITQILTEHPNKDFSLGVFAEKFCCAKSSISEDLRVVRTAVEAAGLGYVETTAGAKGGVRFVPYANDEMLKADLLRLQEALQEPDRVVGGGFLYTSDLMFNPEVIRVAARVFAKKFAALDANFVVTVETRGIGVAMLTAELLNLPLIVLGREARVTDGPTLSINYFAGSTDSIQKMSVSKRAIKSGQKGIIIDDFLRRGGSVKGIEDMLGEFDAGVAGVGVVIATSTPRDKKIGNYLPIMILDNTQDGKTLTINPEIVK